jgi:hypothetical protein
MQCILVNAQARSGMYPGSAFIVHVACRRQAQANDLKHLADIATWVTDASKAHDATTGGATVAWVDFLSGWLSRADTELVEPDSIQMVAQAASTTIPSASAGSVSTPPRATSSAMGSQRTPKASPSGASGGGGSGGAKGGGISSTGNSSGGGGGAGCSAASPSGDFASSRITSRALLTLWATPWACTEQPRVHFATMETTTTASARPSGAAVVRLCQASLWMVSGSRLTGRITSPSSGSSSSGSHF